MRNQILFLNHHDETAIDAICFNHIKTLPLKYNVHRGFYNTDYEKFIEEFTIKQAQEFRYKEKEFEAFNSLVNLLFTRYNKPWGKEKSILKEYWRYYASKTYYMKEIINFYGFSDLLIKVILSKLNDVNATTIKLNVTL